MHNAPICEPHQQDGPAPPVQMLSDESKRLGHSIIMAVPGCRKVDASTGLAVELGSP